MKTKNTKKKKIEEKPKSKRISIQCKRNGIVVWTVWA